MKSVELAIIGGGAAGMFAATVAAERGVKCVLIERKARLGSKVLMTANGRCNFTKDIAADQFLRDVGECAPFVRRAIEECPPRRIIAGFNSLKVPLRRMADGRMFPADGKAATIVHAFGDLLRDQEVPIIVNCAAKAIRRGNDSVAGVGGRGKSAAPRFMIETAHFDLAAENVLIATGGASYPKTGSVGDGQNFARALGHTIVPLRPGLIGLETADARVVRLAGRRFEDGRAKVLAPDGRVLFDYRGEVDCENFGLSGAAVYNAQRFIEHELRRDPALDRRAFTIEVWFDRNRLQFTGLTPRPLKESIVTIGGVDVREIDSATMESKRVPGLYFAGEVMDIDGPTGGYNLTLAFATARKAVAAVANGINRDLRVSRSFRR